MSKLIPLPHPGETIREDILESLGMSVNQLAKTAARLNEMGTSGAASLPTRPYVSLYLGSSPEFWLNLQTDYELRVARAIRRMRERRREIQAEVAGVAKAV